MRPCLDGCKLFAYHSDDDDLLTESNVAFDVKDLLRAGRRACQKMRGGKFHLALQLKALSPSTGAGLKTFNSYLRSDTQYAAMPSIEACSAWLSRLA
jgi:hypothetical protein